MRRRLIQETRLMNKINQMGQSAQLTSANVQEKKAQKKDSSSSFADVLSGVADVALATTATVASVVPGGQLIGLAAGGLYGIKQAVGGKGQGGAQAGAGRDDIDKMWDMQKDNQAYNMEYMQLQQQLQSDNRSFSTLSNLMKVRHDTAKSAINNMHA